MRTTWITSTYLTDTFVVIWFFLYRQFHSNYFKYHNNQIQKKNPLKILYRCVHAPAENSVVFFQHIQSAKHPRTNIVLLFICHTIFLFYVSTERKIAVSHTEAALLSSRFNMADGRQSLFGCDSTKSCNLVI